LPGSKNKLHASFMSALEKSWAENGDAVLRIVIAEQPATYFKTIASLMPREFWMSEGGPVEALSDDDLAQVIAFARAGKKTAA
jgi:hypothetical protein